MKKFVLTPVQQMALRAILYSVGGGAFGLFARWMQLQLAFDESDLPTSSMWNLFFPMVVIAAIVVYIHFTKEYERDHFSLPENFCEAFAFPDKFTNLLRYVAGGLLCVGSLVLFLTCETEKYALMMRILAILGVFSGVSYIVLIGLAQNPESSKSLRLWCAVVPIVLFAWWLILTYKMNDINSVEWDYGIEILADCVGIYSFFRLAGFAYGVPNWKKSMFWAMFVPFCCFVLLADSRVFGLQIMYVGVGAIMLLNNWIFTCNLVKEEPEESAESENDDGFERL